MKHKRKQIIKKGESGYIDSRKKSLGRKSLLMFLVSAGIFFLGLCLNDFSKKNIFTVVAAVSVLPAARMFTSYLVMVPYHSVLKESYDKVKKSLSTEDILYTDVVCTSSDKVMNLAFLVVAGEEIIALTGRSKENADYIKRYLSENLKKRELNFRISICSAEDKFLQHLMHVNRKSVKAAEKKELCEYLESLML